MSKMFFLPLRPAFDSAGVSVPGAQFWFTLAGTNTSSAPYADDALSTPLANPIVANGIGYLPPVYLDPDVSYRVRVYARDSEPGVDTPLEEYDPYVPALAGEDIFSDLAADDGSGVIGFLQTGTGAVARTAQDKLRDIVNAKDFALVGDGSDETAKLTAFFNSAIARPGVAHYLEAKTYGVSSALPNINVSNVWIEGAGAEIHDSGTLVTGTVIKWVGATSTGTTLLTIAPDSDAGGQRLSGIFFRYIGIDCNSGKVGTALALKSLQESDIDVATANAYTAAVTLNVVASLAEARDIQRNRIRINGRQVEAPNGYTLTLDGDSGANASMNEFDVEAQFKNVAAIRCLNSDNNYWTYVRASLAGGGTASYGMELLGAATAGTSSRAEDIEFYSCSLPLKAFGTEAYTAASKGHVIQRIDVDNGTPGPVMGTGATVAMKNSWTTFTPTVTASTGALTTVASQSGQYLLDDAGVCKFVLSFTLTTNGTGSVQLRATLPFAAHSGALLTAISGAETGGTGKALTCTIAPSGTYVAITFYDGTYPGADGRSFSVSGTYRSVF